MDNNCLFCKICKGEMPAEMIHQDDDIAIFKDIKPAAKYHYLAVPKVHVKNAKYLTVEQKPLVEKLIADGMKVLRENGGDVNDMRMGFHWPPFNSISHLHLHLISPASEMGMIHNWMFRPNSWWFVTTDYVMETVLSNKL